MRHFLTVFFLSLALSAQAQDPVAPTPPPALTAQERAALLDEVRALRTDVRKQADLLNDSLARVNPNNDALQWLKAINLKFKVFEPGDSAKSAGLGVEYDFEKAVVDAELFNENNPVVLDFSLKARGTLAFDKNNNPADFLETGVSLHAWQLWGGNSETETVGPDKMTASSRTRQFLAQNFQNKTGAEIRNSPEWKEYIRNAHEKDPADFFYDVAGTFALESNQTFSKKQYAYGLTFQPRYRAWDPDSAWSKFNVFDWPFAFTRSITEKKWQPRGRFLPSPLIGIDLIDPKDNTDRFLIDPDNSVYQRLKLEIAFRSKVLDWESDSIWFNASYRYFREIDASSSIRAARMHESRYFVASLELPKNFMVSYTTGKLPFDKKSDHVYSVGYQFHF